MILTILTAEKKLVDRAQVEEILLPGIEGQLGIYDNHANFVTTIETGVMKWRQGQTWQSGAISRGFLEIMDGTATVLADVAELAPHINVERAKQALEKARAKIEEGGLDDGDFSKYKLKLARAMARMNAPGGSAGE